MNDKKPSKKKGFFFKKWIRVSIIVLVILVVALLSDFLLIQNNLAEAKVLIALDERIASEQASDVLNTMDYKRQHLERKRNIVDKLKFAHRLALNVNIFDIKELYSQQSNSYKVENNVYQYDSFIQEAENALNVTKNYLLAYTQAKLADEVNYPLKTSYPKILMARSYQNLKDVPGYQAKTKELYDAAIHQEDFIQYYVQYAGACMDFKDYSCALTQTQEGIKKYDRIPEENRGYEDIKMAMAYLYGYKSNADFYTDHKDQIKSDCEKSLSFYKLDYVQEYYDQYFKINSSNQVSRPASSSTGNAQEIIDKNFSELRSTLEQSSPATTETESNTWQPKYIAVKYRSGTIDIAHPRWEYLATPGGDDVYGAWYDKENSYMVIRLSSAYYHYCSMPSSIWSDFRSANSFDSFYESTIYGHYDCRVNPVPTY